MDLFQGAGGLIRDIAMSSQPDEVISGVRLFSKEFGFDQLTVVRKLPEPNRLASGLIHIDAPAGFVADFDVRGYARYNPLLTRAERTRIPFTASEVRNSRITEPEIEVLDHLHKTLDVTDGLVVPVASSKHGDGTVMFGGCRPKGTPVVHAMLGVLGVCAYGRIQELAAAMNAPMAEEGPYVQNSERGGLTARERECLKWVAAGKTDFEIGLILGISPRTARFHVENTKKKLGVVSRVQAVTTALRLEAIPA